MEERLQKYLATCGIASRRKCEDLIKSGKVKVNGKVVTELGTKVKEEDVVEFEGKIVQENNKKIYILLNKPIGYVTTVKDQFNRPTVMDLIKKENVRVVPVGRLDMYTSGALILTNDGDFTNKITHPKNQIEKTYNVTLTGIINNEDVEKLKNGVSINVDDKEIKTGKAKVKILKTDEEKNISRIQIVIHEGKNREVRKMCEAIGKKVLALHRAKIGEIDVKNLKIGEYRYLNSNDLKKLEN